MSAIGAVHFQLSSSLKDNEFMKHIRVSDLCNLDFWHIWRDFSINHLAMKILPVFEIFRSFLDNLISFGNDMAFPIRYFKEEMSPNGHVAKSTVNTKLQTTSYGRI